MDTRDFALIYTSLDLSFPARPPFDGTALPRLYAELCERHPFESFAYDEDGAHLSQESPPREVTLSRYRLTLEEESGRDIESVKRDFADMVEVIEDRLDIPVFWEPRIILRALLPMPEAENEGEAAAEMMRTKAVNLRDDQLALLGSAQVRGVTIVLDAVDDSDSQGHGRHVHLEVGPHLRDPDKLHIELADWRHIQLESPSVIEQRMQETYDYLKDHVLRFVATFD